MATFNENFKSVSLPVGTYGLDVLGDNVTASTVHQIFCLTDGSITISALGGGPAFTWAATSGQSIDVMAGQIVVGSGSFVGFKAKTFLRRFTPPGVSIATAGP